MTYVNLTDDEFRQAVAERKAKTKPIENLSSKVTQ
jgi:hypothetical protein